MAIFAIRPVIIRPVIVFAHRHDTLPWFRLWFTVATVTASIVFNLGIFALLVCAHMGLDVIKYRTLFRLRWHFVLVETVRESLVDIFFIALGILLALAFHHAFAIGGLGRLPELEVLLLNMLLRVGPRLKIAEHLLEIITYWRHHFAEQVQPGKSLTRGERGLCIATGMVTLAIMTIPLLRALTFAEVRRITQQELTPRLELSITKTLNELHK